MNESVYAAGSLVRTPEDGYALLLAAIIGQAYRDLRRPALRASAAYWLASPAVADWAAMIDIALPALPPTRPAGGHRTR